MKKVLILLFIMLILTIGVIGLKQATTNSHELINDDSSTSITIQS